MDVLNFVENNCRHSKGQFVGQPFVPLPWQRERIIIPLFGWIRPDGTRRYRRAYIEVPKKNGKSTLCAALGLYMLMEDREPGAEVYIAACDKLQASIIFDESKSMVEKSPELARQLVVVPSQKRIVHHKTGSFYRALSADVKTKEGINASAIIFDELHAQPTRDMFDTLEYAGASRRQPLWISITTAGTDIHSICYEQREYAIKVRDGVIDDASFLPVIYSADLNADWKSPETWKDANPSLGTTLTIDSIADDCKKAIETPAKESSFRRYHLNQWVQSDNKWLSTDQWNACREAFSEKELIGQPCYGGLDLASTTDITAFSLVFPGDDVTRLLTWFWVPKEGAEKRARKDRVPYLDWIKDQHISATPGNVTDYDFVHRDIMALSKKFHIKEIAYDRWNATQLAVNLQGEGLKMIDFGQGFRSMAAPSKEFEKMIIGCKIRHNGNPVMNWMISNTCVEVDAAGNIKPSKARSREKIDGVVASIMALGRAMLVPAGGAKSVYETRGFVTI
ncbi:MAG: terminase large subunit [Phycisphaerae bacterium]